MVSIGVYVCSEPLQMRATVAALRRNTKPPIEIILLPDGVDAVTREACRSFPELRQLSTAAPLGAPACFNRLVRSTSTPIIVFLESGALVAPRWLERLTDALSADPCTGLAGPSTNRAWNEQCVFPYATSDEADIERTAASAAARYGSATRRLAPLYSLSDFCYAVRRKVIDMIGLADEGFGRGPCWEMDYNIRAERAGFRGLWVMGAYVHRLPCTERRRQDEASLAERNQRWYQDKFCALHLRGERTEYEPRCAGDACEHFAPARLIRIRAGGSPSETAVHAAGGATINRPLVTCIMPTRARPAWLQQSIDYFQRQDYSPRELVIVDDGDEDLSGRLPDDASIRYVRTESITTGAKRNLACDMARGEYIAHWDDDDWYGSGRLTAQLAPLLAGEADITGLRTDLFFELPTWRFWRCAPELHRRMFVGDVSGATLVFDRRIWERLSRYSNETCGEDADFLRGALQGGARLRVLNGGGHFIYLRHGFNTWAFRCGEFGDPTAWDPVPPPAHFRDDRPFYLSMSSAFAAATRGECAVEPRGPLVSCIMPTCGRRDFVPQAIRLFLRQDYPHRELIIIDDGRDKIADLLPADDRIQYVALAGHVPLGSKRNLACERSRGSIIAHWDDDDWMADWRLSYQIRSLLDGGADLCGLASLVHFDPVRQQAWRYVSSGIGGPWLAGGSLCYTKDLWRATRFPALDCGEDAQFVAASAGARILALPDDRFYAALVHAGNTNLRRTLDPRYKDQSFEEVVERIGADYPVYVRQTLTPRTADLPAPVISCMMPTRDRRIFVPQAIRCFLRQDFAARELIVVDDGLDRIADLVPEDGRVRYISLPQPLSLGEKRNVAVRASRGSIIAHWDDDDWYHPQYLSRVWSRLQSPAYPRAVNGLGTFLVLIVGEPDVRVCRTAAIAGATIAYARDLWESCGYRAVTMGEDTFFLEDTAAVIQPDHHAPWSFMVVRHGDHTWRTDNGCDVTTHFRTLPRHDRGIIDVAGEDAGFYLRAEHLLLKRAAMGDPARDRGAAGGAR